MLPYRQNGWTPAPFRPLGGEASLAQIVVPPPGSVPAGPDAVDQAMGSPTVALVSDFATAGLAAYVAFELGSKRVNSSWSTFWWMITTAAVVKGLHDIKRLNS